MDDIATLVAKTTATLDEYGNQIFDEETADVFVQVLSVTRMEFYSAAQAGLRPDIVLRISNPADYNGEKEADFHGKRYEIVRTYRAPYGDAIDLTLEEKHGTHDQGS